MYECYFWFYDAYCVLKELLLVMICTLNSLWKLNINSEILTRMKIHLVAFLQCFTLLGALREEKKTVTS